MPANNFEIEVTERTVMNSANETVSKLVRLKQLGFKISIDDFGTGYSSLSYLVRFPLDCLKLIVALFSILDHSMKNRQL